MVKSKKPDTFFKRQASYKEESNIASKCSPHEKNCLDDAPTSEREEQPSKILKVTTSNEFDINPLVCECFYVMHFVSKYRYCKACISLSFFY